MAGLESAMAGDPVVVPVGGEAGVGKTRLVEEAAAHARDGGSRVLTGSCIEVGGEGLPLSPVVGALRSLMRQMAAPELDEVLGPARIELARLLPELDPHSPVSPAAAGAEGNARVLELVFGVVQRLSAERPLMLVIEDLHWADRSTLDLVALLVRALRDARVLLTITFRSDELHRNHPLRPPVTGWERVRSVRRIELPRFTREEVAKQLEAILGTRPTRAMLDLLYERSEGNAFLIEEMGEHERLALVLESQAQTVSVLGRPGEAFAVLERAASLLPAEPPSVARAVVLASLARATAYAGDFEGCMRVAEQALSAARAARAPEQGAHAQIMLGVAQC